MEGKDSCLPRDSLHGFGSLGTWSTPGGQRAMFSGFAFFGACWAPSWVRCRPRSPKTAKRGPKTAPQDRLKKLLGPSVPRGSLDCLKPFEMVARAQPKAPRDLQDRPKMFHLFQHRYLLLSLKAFHGFSDVDAFNSLKVPISAPPSIMRQATMCLGGCREAQIIEKLPRSVRKICGNVLETFQIDRLPPL